MKYVRMTGRRNSPDGRGQPFQRIIDSLDGDTDFVAKFPKGAKLMRVLLEATYTKGYMDAQSKVAELGDNLSNGWQSLTGGATWQEVSDAMEEDEVPIPDEFYSYIHGESLETIFGDILTKAAKEIEDSTPSVKEFFMKDGDED